MGIIGWIKRNKLASLLLLIIGFYLFKNFLNGFYGISRLGFSSPSYNYAQESMGISAPANMKMAFPGIGGGGSYYPNSPAPPTTDVTNRMVVQNSYLSLVVKKVADTLQSIKTYTTSIGGYMVNSDITNPEDNSSGNITLRIPSEKLEDALSKFRSLSVKVASERLNGTDVTDQYVDNEARLTVLNANMTRFKEIMSQANELSDILNIQQQIFSLQDQIDRIKGSNKYIEQTAKMSLVTVYLSTDEYTLPYAPSEPWRPDVIFKTAVRSLIGNLRGIASTAIWLVVYSVIWVPVLILVLYIRGRKKRSGLQ